jgi:hypothetical protein
MKYALFHGCNIPARVEQYADATMAVSDIRSATRIIAPMSSRLLKI